MGVRMRIASVFIICFLLISCVAPLLNFSKSQYISKDFDSATFFEGGLALLPVTAGYEQEGLRRPVGERLAYCVKGYYPELRFLSSEESLSRLNDSNMAKAYSDMLNAYSNTAIIDKLVLNEMGKVLKVRYALQARLLKQDSTSSLQAGILTRGVYVATNNSVLIFGQVWDMIKGDVVWEGVGNASVQSSELTYINTHFDEIVDQACKGLIWHLLKR
jgi:hypothetical protein